MKTSSCTHVLHEDQVLLLLDKIPETGAGGAIQSFTSSDKCRRDVPMGVADDPAKREIANGPRSATSETVNMR